MTATGVDGAGWDNGYFLEESMMKNRWVIAAILAFALAGCKSAPPRWPAAGDVHWSTYTRADVGFSVSVPDIFRPEQIGDDTVFYANGFPIFRVLWVDEAAARQRGLWVASQPVGTVTVAGQPARHYVYDHGDFVTYTPTIAYVLPWHGKQLGIEFRIDGDSLNATAQHMLDSFERTRE